MYVSVRMSPLQVYLSWPVPNCAEDCPLCMYQYVPPYRSTCPGLCLTVLRAALLVGYVTSTVTQTVTTLPVIGMEVTVLMLVGQDHKEDMLDTVTLVSITRLSVSSLNTSASEV